MGSKPLGGFTAAICMIKDGEKEKEEPRSNAVTDNASPVLTFMRASSTSRLMVLIKLVTCYRIVPVAMVMAFYAPILNLPELKILPSFSK